MKRTTYRVNWGAPIRSKSNQAGSVAVVVALLMTLLLSVMAFTMDTGYLYQKHDRYQNAVEAAALSAVQRLCDGDWKVVARNILVQHGIDTDFVSLLVETGFYDSREEYGDDLGEFKDFGSPSPSGEYDNAVHIRLEESTDSFSGLNRETTVVAEAVAYLQRIDMVSLDPQGSIRIGNSSVWENVVFFSNGDISYPESVTLKKGVGSSTYSAPEFNNCLLYAAGQVRSSLPIDKSSDFLGIQKVSEILWDSGSPQSESHTLSGVDPIDSIRPVNDEYLEEWRDKADIIYTPDQAGNDDVFYYASTVYSSFDLTGVSGVVFFDGEENAGLIEVHIDPQTPQASSNNSITNVIFVTNCSIKLLNTSNTGGSSHQVVKLNVGGEDEDLAMFISTGDIEIDPKSGDNIQFKGAVFRTGGNFILEGIGGGDSHKIRVIADGDISGKSNLNSSYYGRTNTEIGLFGITINSRFGPPCPPVMARLGRLEPSEK